jgi:hypothetical protein
LSVCTLVLNQNHTTMAQQQQQLSGTSFQIDNITFSDNTASVNGIQLHYVIGGHGDPIVLLCHANEYYMRGKITEDGYNKLKKMIDDAIKERTS